MHTSDRSIYCTWEAPLPKTPFLPTTRQIHIGRYQWESNGRPKIWLDLKIGTVKAVEACLSARINWTIRQDHDKTICPVNHRFMLCIIAGRYIGGRITEFLQLAFKLVGSERRKPPSANGRNQRRGLSPFGAWATDGCLSGMC